MSTLSMLSMFRHPIPRLSINHRPSMESTVSIHSSPPYNISSRLRQYIVLPQTKYCTLTFGLGVLSLRKIKFYLLFRSLNRTLTSRSKLLSLGNTQINLVFRSLIRNFVLVSRRLRPLWTWVGGGQDIYKGVYYALVLTF